MPVNKEHMEFFKLDTGDDGWEVPEGYPEGIQQKIITGKLDTVNKKGGHARLLRFLPGAFSTVPFVHDYWEEVYVISGDLIVGNDENGQGGEAFPAQTYCCRPPGVPHGPFASKTGCLLLEQHYYDPQ